MKLRALEHKDAAGMFEWMKDVSISYLFRFDPSAVSLEDAEKFIHAAQSDPKTKHFAIADGDDVYLGTVSLKNIDALNQTAEYAISLRSRAIGTGVAAFATDEILKVAFNDLKLNKVYLYVPTENIRAWKFYEKYGFSYECTRHLCLKGAFRDIKWYRMLKSEYEEKLNASRLQNGRDQEIYRP